MTIAVTGATGQLGRLVLTSLRERGVPAADLVALARDTSRLDDWAERGVRSGRPTTTSPPPSPTPSPTSTRCC